MRRADDAGDRRDGDRSGRGRAAGARDDGRDQRAVGEKGRPRRPRHDARLPRPAGTAPLVARRSVRSVPGPPDMLVPRRWRFEVTERIDAQGEVVTPLAEDEIDALVAAIRDAGLETVAVALLFSFLNDAHERRLGERLRAALPGVGSICPARCCPRSASSSAPARPRSAPMSGRCWPPISTGCKRAASQARPAAALCDGVERRRVRRRRGAAHAGDGGRESGPAAGVVAAALAGAAARHRAI